MVEQSTSVQFSRDNEMMVLGSAINSKYGHKLVSESLSSSDFFISEHVSIHQALQNLFLRQKNADLHLISEELKSIGKLEQAGGTSYLITLAQFAGTSAHIEEYIDNLKKQSLCIKASLALEDNMRRLRESSDPIEALESCQKELSEITKRYSPSDGAELRKVLHGDISPDCSTSLLDRIKERQEYFRLNNKPYLTGIPSGIESIDSALAIFEKTNLTILAGRPSMGKTALGLQFASNVAHRYKNPVAFMSLEMGRDQLAERLLSMHSGIPLEKIKRGELSHQDLERISVGYNELVETPLIIYDRHISTISNIISRARRLKDEKGIELLIIDYLQLIGTGGSSESRQYEVAEVSRRLKQLALEIETPILCLAQLSRKVEERADKRPFLSDLRDSGQIEQDCDIAMFVFRQDYYDPEETPGKTELIVAKNRNGPLANITLDFQKETGRFCNLSKMGSSEAKKGIRF